VVNFFAARTVMRPLLVSMVAFAFAASPMVMRLEPTRSTTSPPERSTLPLLVSALTVPCHDSPRSRLTDPFDVSRWTSPCAAAASDTSIRPFEVSATIGASTPDARIAPFDERASMGPA